MTWHPQAGFTQCHRSFAFINMAPPLCTDSFDADAIPDWFGSGILTDR